MHQSPCPAIHPIATQCAKRVLPFFLGYNLQRNTRIIYSLWVPHFSENNVVVSYLVPFHAAQKSWNGLIIRLQAPKSFDRRSLFQSLEMIAGNQRIRPVTKLQNTSQLTPSLNLLLPQSRSRHNLHNKLYIKTTNIYMLFAGWEVRIVKNCDRGLENAARGRRPRAAFSRPRSQFFTMRTDLSR